MAYPAPEASSFQTYSVYYLLKRTLVSQSRDVGNLRKGVFFWFHGAYYAGAILGMWLGGGEGEAAHSFLPAPSFTTDTSNHVAEFYLFVDSRHFPGANTRHF